MKPDPNAAIIDVLLHSGHGVLVTSADNPHYHQLCASILRKSKARNRFCLLETNEPTDAASQRMVSAIHAHIDPRIIDQANTNKIGDEDSLCGEGFCFNPACLSAYVDHVLAGLAQGELEGFTSVHTSTFQYINAIENPNDFMLEGELMTTHAFEDMDNILVLCSYRLTPDEFQDQRLPKFLAYHRVVVFLDDDGRLLLAQDAARAIIDRIGAAEVGENRIQYSDFFDWFKWKFSGFRGRIPATFKVMIPETDRREISPQENDRLKQRIEVALADFNRRFSKTVPNGLAIRHQGSVSVYMEAADIGREEVFEVIAIQGLFRLKEEIIAALYLLVYIARDILEMTPASIDMVRLEVLGYPLLIKRLPGKYKTY